MTGVQTCALPISRKIWGVSKLMKKGRESQKVKPGSKVTPIEPVEGTELLNKKEIKKFNKAVKTLQETIWNFEDQVKKAAKGKEKPEEEEVKPETGEEQEKPKSLAGTTQTALIPGEEAPAELDQNINIISDLLLKHNVEALIVSNTTDKKEKKITGKGKILV